MTIVFIRAVIVYTVLIFSVRLMGKRQIGELQPSELAITILISNIATLPLEETGIPLIKGLQPVMILVCLEVIMSWFSIKSKKVRSVMSGEPVIIISNGEIDQQKLYNLRFSTDDLMEAIRSQGIFDISEVQYAVVETTGKVNVMPKFPNRPVTNEDIAVKGELNDPPALVIQDGNIMKSSLRRLCLTEKWLDAVLRENKVALREIFIMTAETAGKYTIIKKDIKKAVKGEKIIDKS
ncbi:MAG: DUF421 domain-containing protein [Huintestinicola sp.]